MPRALTKKQGEKIKLELLEQRENNALEELQELGFRISLYEQRRYVEEDPLLGTTGGWLPGTCYAVIDSVDGKRKNVSGTSAVEVLSNARGWLRYQETHFAPEDRFKPAPNIVAVPVTQRIVGDTAETANRKVTRRVIQLDSDERGDHIPGNPARVVAETTV
jgi:hypothetical protein